MAFFVAFYSYKGGVGRSLALANVGYALADAGKRVVLLDMDLEAPGLSEFREFKPAGRGPRKGFVEYATAYRRTGQNPRIEGYVHACQEMPGNGKLWLMPAGQVDARYPERLSALPWHRLHDRKGTEPFLTELRQALVQAFRPDYVLIDSRTGFSDIGGISTHRLADMVVLVFNLTRECLAGSVQAYGSFSAEASQVRAVQLVASPVPSVASGDSLVDRRLQKAQELMPLGVAYGRRIVRIDYDPALALAEELAVRRTDDFSRIVQPYQGLREEIQRANPEDVFPLLERIRALRAAGNNAAAVEELSRFVKDHPQSWEGALELGNLFMELQRIPEAIQAFRAAEETVPDHPLAHRRLGEALVASDLVAEAIAALKKAEELGEQSRELYDALARAYALKPDPVREIEARRKALLSLLLNRPSEARSAPLATLHEEFISVLSRRPPFSGFSPQQFWQLLMGSLSLGAAAKRKALQDLLSGSFRPPDVQNLQEMLKSEEEKWRGTLGPGVVDLQRRILESGVDPEDLEALPELRRGAGEDAVLLHFMGTNSSLPPARRVELLEEAATLEPEDPYAFLTLGWALYDLAMEDPGTPPNPALERAVQAFERACEVQPTEAQGFYGLGTALEGLARLQEPARKVRLLRRAIECHQEALRLQPEFHKALSGWGNALRAMARTLPSGERRELLQAAIKRYKRAIQLKPDYHQALAEWGSALMALAQGLPVEKQRDLLGEAIERFRGALQAQPDNYRAFNGWACALLELGVVSPDCSRMFWEEAVQKSAQAAALGSANGFYNLACALSRLGHFDEAQEELQKALAGKSDFLRSPFTDPDLQPLWQARPELRVSLEGRGLRFQATTMWTDGPSEAENQPLEGEASNPRATPP